MWSQTKHNLIAFKYDSALESLHDELRQKEICEFLYSNYQLEPQEKDFEKCLLMYTAELAAKAQNPSFYHGVVSPSCGIYYALFEYEIEEAGIEALNQIISLIQSVLNGEAALPLHEIRKRVNVKWLTHKDGPTSTMIIEAAKARGIPVSKGPAQYTILGQGIKQRRLSAAISHTTTFLGVSIAGDKDDTKAFLRSVSIPVPEGRLVREESELSKVAQTIGFPLVAKPYNGNHDRNLTCGITNYEDLLLGFRSASEVSRAVIIEKEIKGFDYRLLVIGNKFVAASLRRPAFVVGDGFSTVAKLIEKENLNPLRGEGHESSLTKIKCDSVTELQLQKHGFTLSSVPSKGQEIERRATANLSTGGTAEDVTDLIHPLNKLAAEKIARVIGLDICGIDVMSPNIAVPLKENGAAVIEVNAAPGLRMHKFPTKGKAR